MPQSTENKNVSDLSISAIKKRYSYCEPEPAIIALLENDPRSGVKALAQQIRNRKAGKEIRAKKQAELYAIEKNYYASGMKFIAGVDEAGRGPLAGPVIAASVILPADIHFDRLDDSKKLTPALRETLFGQITKEALSWGIGLVDNDEIDETNILKAAMKAMRTAVENMKIQPEIVLIDGNRSPGTNIKEELIIEGDGRCRAIAAASILAKVTRDRIMRDMAVAFPGYGFEHHKGYGSTEHIDAIRRLGPCELHRLTFKIVPAVAPHGTVSALLEKRLESATSISFLEKVAMGIKHMKDLLSSIDISHLREVYKVQKTKLQDDRKLTGDRGEETSCRYLMQKGYLILDRNWRAEDSRYELDIVAVKGSSIIFCEVKTARTKKFGPSVTWVTPEKAARISQAANEYIIAKNLKDHTYRFDVIGLQAVGDTYEINHIENAFSAPEDM